MAIDYSAIAEAGGIAKGPSPFDRAKDAQREEDRTEREVYALVTAREENRCRVCTKWCNPHAIGVLYRAHHHHVIYRSLGGLTTTRNVILICPDCHQDEHKGKLRITGDADIREGGKLIGICVERPTDGVWEVVKWC